MSEIQMGTIQWFPGHMTKTRRMIAANLSLVDAVVEILDARIPSSSQNPEMQRLVKEKPRMLLLNKADMADPNATARWVQYYQKQNLLALPLDCKTIKQRNYGMSIRIEKDCRGGIRICFFKGNIDFWINANRKYGISCICVVTVMMNVSISV